MPVGDDRYGDRSANKRSPGRLCLWHEKLTVSDDSPLLEYRGIVFEAEAPVWDKY